MSISVKVCRIPGSVNEVILNDDATVADALSAAGQTVGAGETVNLNGFNTTTDAPVNDGDRVIIAKGAKGNK